MDPTKKADFAQSKSWRELDFSIFNTSASDDALKSNSFSGNERNRLFMQTEDNFEDVSHVSGADFRQDGRGFVLVDFDKDGWVDLAVSSPHNPRFRLLRNTIGDGVESPNQSAFIKLIGGNQKNEARQDVSARQPFGAKFLVHQGDSKRAYQYSCSEGLSSQNSDWIHIGMGQTKVIDRVDIIWPSGKKTSHEKIRAGDRVTLYEISPVE